MEVARGKPLSYPVEHYKTGSIIEEELEYCSILQWKNNVGDDWS